MCASRFVLPAHAACSVSVSERPIGRARTSPGLSDAGRSTSARRYPLFGLRGRRPRELCRSLANDGLASILPYRNGRGAGSRKIAAAVGACAADGVVFEPDVATQASPRASTYRNTVRSLAEARRSQRSLRTFSASEDRGTIGCRTDASERGATYAAVEPDIAAGRTRRRETTAAAERTTLELSRRAVGTGSSRVHGMLIAACWRSQQLGAVCRRLESSTMQGSVGEGSA